MAALDDLPIPSPSLGPRLPSSGSLDSLDTSPASVRHQQRQLHNGEQRQSSPSPRRRGSVLSALSPLTHFSTSSLGLKPRLTKEQARARTEIPSPPATTQGSDNASVDSRDRYTPPQRTDDARSSRHARSTSSPQHSPLSSRRSSLAPRPSPDGYEEVSNPRASGDRQATVSRRSSMASRDVEEVAAAIPSSARIRLRTTATAQQRERNQRLIDSINTTINAPPRSPSKRHSAAASSSHTMTRATSSSSSTLSAGPSRSHTRSPSPLGPLAVEEQYTDSPHVEHFANDKRNSVITLSSGALDALSKAIDGHDADRKGKRVVRDEVQQVLDARGILAPGASPPDSKLPSQDSRSSTVGPSERRRWDAMATRSTHLPGTSRFESPRHQRAQTSLGTYALESSPSSAGIERRSRSRSGTPFDDIHSPAVNGAHRPDDDSSIDIGRRPARTATVGPRVRPPLPREFLDTARDRVPVDGAARARTPSLSSLSERARHDSNSSGSSARIARPERLALEGPADRRSYSSMRSATSMRSDRSIDIFDRTRSPSRASTSPSASQNSRRPRRTSDVGSEQWWSEVDELRQRAQQSERPYSRASTVAYDTPPARDRLLRGAQSSLAMRDDSAFASTPSRMESAAARRSRTSLGQALPSTSSPALDVPHHALLQQAVDRVSQFLRDDDASGGDADSLFAHIATLSTSVLKLNTGLKALVAAGVDVQLHVELDDEQTAPTSSPAILQMERTANTLARHSDEQVRCLTELLLTFIRHERERERTLATRTLTTGEAAGSPFIAAHAARLVTSSSSRGSPSGYSSPLVSRASPVLERSPLATRRAPSDDLPAAPDRHPVRPSAKSSTASDATIRRASSSAAAAATATIQRSPAARLSRQHSTATSAIDATDAFANANGSRNGLAGLGLGLGATPSSGAADEPHEKDRSSPTRSRRFSGGATRAADALRMATATTGRTEAGGYGGEETLRRARTAR